MSSNVVVCAPAALSVGVAVVQSCGVCAALGVALSSCSQSSPVVLEQAVGGSGSWGGGKAKVSVVPFSALGAGRSIGTELGQSVSVDLSLVADEVSNVLEFVGLVSPAVVPEKFITCLTIQITANVA